MAKKIRFTAWSFLKNLIGIPVLFSLLLAYLSPVLHPDTAWIIPFFGLLYPIILIIGIIYTVIASLKRSRWALIIGGLLILGISFHLRLVAFGATPSPEDVQPIKFMSYNVHLFDRYGGSIDSSNKNRIKMISYIHQESPDIMCFQEFYQQDRPTTFSTRDTLLRLFPGFFHHEHYLYKKAGHQNFGVTILSRYPMIEKGNVIFDQDTHSSNYCIYTDIVRDLDTIRVYNVHLQSVKLGNDYALFDENQNTTEKRTWLRVINKLNKAYPIRADQAIRITEHIEQSPYPVVVCGDFNDTPMSYTYSEFSSILTDSFLECGSGIGVTYAGNVPAGRIDYIFHSPELGSGDFNIQDEAISDHYAIFSKIFVKNE